MNGPDNNEGQDVAAWLRAEAPEYAEDFQRLQRLLRLLDRYHRETWQRHVAAGDTLIDRWDRARQLGFGEGSSVYDSALVLGDVAVGRNTWVGPNTVLDGSGGLTIGDWCSISSGVQIYSHDSIERSISGGTEPIRRAATSVGSNTHLGPNSIVGRGVHIGEKCIVGASSLVLKDVPDGSVALGIPAKVTESTAAYRARQPAPPDGSGGP